MSAATEFDDLVNMTPKELEEFLGSEESKAVGQKDGGSESTGHASGRRIVEIKRTKRADLSDADREHMEKVVGYVYVTSLKADPKTTRSTPSGVTA